VELAAVAALTLGHERVPLTATPFFLAVAWVSLRLRGLRFRDVGFEGPPSWPKAVLVGVAAGAALETFSTLVTVPALARLTGRPPDLSDFRPLVGNERLLALAVVASWLLAAFGEELVFRGYMLNRAVDVFGPTRAGWAAALLAVTVVFGYCHEEQGITGILQEGLAGLLLALLYLAARRNLAVPIVAHGVSNTIAFVLMYLGRYPGL
jgi:membrane protease YdiL (CAAX protease family)